MRLRVLGFSAVIAGMLTGCGSEDGGNPATATAAVTLGANRVATPVEAGGCQSRSSYNPWGVAASRTWTPKTAAEPENPLSQAGTVYGAAFAGRLVLAYGADVGESHRTAILELADGCRRQFRVDSFSPADVAMIDAEMQRHPLVPDTAVYDRQFREGVASQRYIDEGKLVSYTTQHFAIWYGTDTRGDMYSSLRDQNRTIDRHVRETGEWLEKQWLINRDIVGSPMPYASGPARSKLDVYVCGTGLPWKEDGDLRECGASAAEVMNISNWGFFPGSSTLVHEFGHMVQFYTGGFRDKGDAGMIWETGAEWNAFQVSPTFGGFTAYYQANLESGPLFSHSRYGAFPFMQYLSEKDDTRAIVWRSWRENLRNATGGTLEDYVQTFVRLGQASGAYPNGYKSFADDMGRYGARLAAMDFLNQRTMLDSMRATRTTSWISHFYAPLATVATTTDSTVYASSPQRPLLQYGTHIVPLTATATKVSVKLTGGTKANDAAWRFTIVAVRDGAVATYAPMASVEAMGTAGTSLDVPAGTKLYLTVTATPYAYETLGWQEDGKPTFGTKFPYRVKIEGATPRTGPAAPCDPQAQPGATNLNYNVNGYREGGKPCSAS